jgi:hypothetical protein
MSDLLVLLSFGGCCVCLGWNVGRRFFLVYLLEALRYRWMKQHYIAADFDWNGKTILAIQFEGTVSSDLDSTIDTALELDRQKRRQK